MMHCGHRYFDRAFDVPLPVLDGGVWWYVRQGVIRIDWVRSNQKNGLMISEIRGSKSGQIVHGI